MPPDPHDADDESHRITRKITPTSMRMKSMLKSKYSPMPRGTITTNGKPIQNS
jgi:hypothetical protein